MPQHTPGPWINCHTHVDDSRGLPLVVAATRDFDRINCSDFALIAAAPELLAALEECVIVLESLAETGTALPRMHAEARAAIAKARGEVMT
jgi:hypothetical protein